MEVMEMALREWVHEGCEPDQLARGVARAAFEVWAVQGVRDQGLPSLRAAAAWLRSEVAEDNRRLAVGSIDSQVLAAVGREETGMAEDMHLALDVLDGGKVPSFDELVAAKQRTFGDFPLAAEAGLQDAIAAAWSGAIPGLVLSSAAAAVEVWWQGLSDPRVVVGQATMRVIEALRYRTRLRVQATWPGGLANDGFAPAFRSEGDRLVPWFVSKELVQEVEVLEARKREASGAEGAARASNLPGIRERPDTSVTERKEGNLASFMVDAARKVTGGRCMYCGSNDAIKAVYVWPLEIGGTEGPSNFGCSCGLCYEFKRVLGPKRWGEVLAEDPEEAVISWWTSQKEADEEARRRVEELKKSRPRR